MVDIYIFILSLSTLKINDIALYLSKYDIKYNEKKKDLKGLG